MMGTFQFGDPRLPDRFWRNHTYNAETGCWLCTLTPDKDGYCRIRRKDEQGWINIAPYRWSYQVLVGPITEQTINHRCLVKSCSNPGDGHACEPMSLADNVREAKSRVSRCPQGHPYDFKNTHVRSDGRRECKQCMRDRTARQRAAKRAAAG